MGGISIVNGDYKTTYNWGGYHLVKKMMVGHQVSHMNIATVGIHHDSSMFLLHIWDGCDIWPLMAWSCCGSPWCLTMFPYINHIPWPPNTSHYTDSFSTSLGTERLYSSGPRSSRQRNDLPFSSMIFPRETSIYPLVNIQDTMENHHC